MSVEDRIREIFTSIDEYMERHSFESLSLDDIIALTGALVSSRRIQETYNKVNPKLHKLENNLQWLKGVMIENNLVKISR